MRAFKRVLTLLIALTLILSVGVLPTMAYPEAGTASGVSSLTLDKSTLQMTTGDDGVLTATMSPRPEVAQVQWSSSDTTVVSVAIVDDSDYPGDTQIKVHAKQAGTATITAKIDQLTATCQVTVGDGAASDVSSLTLDKSTLQMTTGDDGVLTATMSPRPEAAKVQWSSSDATVVSVAIVEDPNYPGNTQIKVHANQAGTATITAKVDQLTATCQVRVEPFMVIFYDTNGDSLGSRMGDSERKVTPPEPPNLGEHAHFAYWSDELTGGNRVNFKEPITGKTNFYPQYTFDEGWVLLRAKLTHVANAANFPKVVNHTDGRLLAFQFRPERGYQFPQFIPVTTTNADGTIKTLQEGRDYTYEYVSGAFAVFGYNIPFSVTITGFIPPPPTEGLGTAKTDNGNQLTGNITTALINESMTGSIQGLPGVSQGVTNNGTKLDIIHMPIESGEAGIDSSLVTLLGKAPNTVALQLDIRNGMVGGTASVLLPGGFGNITETGRLLYPMNYNATAPHEKDILALAKDVNAYDTLMVGGNYVLPCKATVVLSTDLPAGTPVEFQHYNPYTGALTSLGESLVDEHGKTHLYTSVLGEILIVNP